MRRSERLILAAILLLGAALRLWGLTFGVPHSETRPGETAIVRSAARLFAMYQYAAVHATPFLIVARVIAVVSGVATIWLVYRLVERLIDRRTAITAAFFVAVAFLHVRDSHFGLTGVPMTALAVAALVALAAAVGDPMLRRRWVLTAVLSGLAAAAILGARHFFEGPQVDVTHVMESRGIVVSRGWVHHLTFSLWYGLGAPLFVAGVSGMALLVATSWTKAVMILTFPILYYVTVGRGYTALVQHVTPVVPFLCVTAAFLVVRIVRRFVRPESVPQFVTLVAVVLALPSIARDLAFDVLIKRTDTRVLAQQWTEEHVPAGDTIGQIPPVLIYPDFGIARPANLATFDIDRKAFISTAGATVSPDWIMVPTSPLTAFTVSPDELATIANREYVRETSITATHGPEQS